MGPKAVLRQALRGLRRDWSAGELRVLALALAIAVASVAAVGFFTDRIRLTMERQAGELLAADLVVASREPVSAPIREAAAARGLAMATTLGFRSVVLAGGETALAEVKAVSPGYPLRGELGVSDAPFGTIEPTREIPPPGSVWPDPRLAQGLGVGVGDVVEVGASALRVDRILAYEPDRGGDLFSIAPRLLMNLADVPATELVQPGSRVQHRLLLAGESAAVDGFRAWAGSRLGSGEEIEGVRDARPELRVALDRAQQFLGLAALVSVILAGVAVAIAARRFAARHWDAVAVMRCVGATQGLVLALYLAELLILAVLAGLAGVVVGYMAQEGLSRILAGLAGSALPLPSLAPAAPALATGLVTLVGFGLPPILGLREVPPLRVLRRDLGPGTGRRLSLYLPAVVAVAALLLWQAADVRLATYVLGGAAGTLLVLALAAWALVRGLEPLRGRVGVAWRFGLANIARRGGGSVVQVVALGLGMMVLLVLTLVRNDLLASWEATLPPDAPNYFLINVQTGEVDALTAFLAGQGLTRARLHPMVRGRLVAMNDRPVVPGDYGNPRAQRLAERDFNLSWAATLQDDNRIVAGRWWGEGALGEAQVSVEEGLAETLGIALGDRLRFLVAGQAIEAPVTSLRTVEWDSFRANFFVLFPPGVLEDYPATWITSFHLEPEQRALVADLVKAFPAVTVLDVDALMTKVRQIIDQVVLAVQYVFLFTLGAGLVVLYAAIQATHDERRFESAVVRTLGGQRAVIRRSLVAEFATLGLLAGVLAALSATLLGYVLAEHLFGFPYHPDPLLWIVGAVAGAAGVGAAGLLGTRAVLNQPPMLTLREG